MDPWQSRRIRGLAYAIRICRYTRPRSHACSLDNHKPYKRGAISYSTTLSAWVKRKEPFFRDGRMNELGACWEDYVFGGMLHMLGKPTGAIIPYGISSIPFPGFSRNYPSSIDRENPRKWGIEWQTEYPIEMQHVRDMFTSEMWDEVHRYGIKRLRRKRKLGYRRYVDEKLFAGLAPGEAVRGVAPSPTASVASMDAEDDDKGVVRRP
jgi:hypothetical protein